MTQDQREPISSTLAAGSSRRGVLRAFSVIGAGGLLALGGHGAGAAARPHQRLQDRTPQRNRKQRNKNQNNNNQNNNSDNNQNTNGGGGLGSIFGPGTSLPFHNQSTVSFWVQIPASDQGLWCGPGYLGTLDAGSDATAFVINYSQWLGSLHIGAGNPDWGDPWVEFGREGSCDTSDPQYVECTYDTRHLDDGESFQCEWGGSPDGVESRSFTAERQSDSSDYKMFLITALA